MNAPLRHSTRWERWALREAISRFRYPDFLDKRIADVFSNLFVPYGDEEAALNEIEHHVLADDETRRQMAIEVRCACAAIRLERRSEIAWARRMAEQRPQIRDEDEYSHGRTVELSQRRIAREIYAGGQ